jgi:hypothetical protein
MVHRDETIAVIGMFSHQILDRNLLVMLSESYSKFCSHLSRIFVAHCQLRRNTLMTPVSYAAVVAECLRESGGDPHLVSALDRVGLMDEVIEWASSMQSDDHKASLPILMALGEAPHSVTEPTLQRKLINAVAFLYSVSPCFATSPAAATKDSSSSPDVLSVRETAKRLLPVFSSAFGTSVAVDRMFGPGRLESPALVAFRGWKAELLRIAQSELLSTILDLRQFTRRELDVFDIQQLVTVGSGSPPASNPPTAVQPTPVDRRTEQEVARLKNVTRDLISLSSKTITNKDISDLLIRSQGVDPSAPAALRRRVSFVSYVFYRSYRVCIPVEEIPVAMVIFEHELNDLESWTKPAPGVEFTESFAGIVRSFYAFSSLVYFIHPFEDDPDNKVARLLSTVILRQHQCPVIPLKPSDKAPNFHDYVQRIADLLALHATSVPAAARLAGVNSPVGSLSPTMMTLSHPQSPATVPGMFSRT